MLGPKHILLGEIYHLPQHSQSKGCTLLSCIYCVKDLHRDFLVRGRFISCFRHNAARAEIVRYALNATLISSSE